jgi:hypothetical protein
LQIRFIGRKNVVLKSTTNMVSGCIEYTSNRRFNLIVNSFIIYVFTVQRVYNGYWREPENMPFMWCFPLYTGLNCKIRFIGREKRSTQEYNQHGSRLYRVHTSSSVCRTQIPNNSTTSMLSGFIEYTSHRDHSACAKCKYALYDNETTECSVYWEHCSTTGLEGRFNLIVNSFIIYVFTVQRVYNGHWREPENTRVQPTW